MYQLAKEVLPPSNAVERREPLPEALDNGAGWEIYDSGTDGQPATAPSQKTMFVPLGTTECLTCGVDHFYAIRRHEIAHAKYTPKNFVSLHEKYEKANNIKLDDDCLQVVEDLRISHYQSGAGVPMPLTFCKKNLEEDRKTWGLRSWEDRIKTMISRRLMPEDWDYVYELERWCHNENKFPTENFYDNLQTVDACIRQLTTRPTGQHTDRPNYNDTCRAAEAIGNILKSQRSTQLNDSQKQMKRRVQEARKEIKEQIQQKATQGPTVTESTTSTLPDSQTKKTDNAKEKLDQAKSEGKLANPGEEDAAAGKAGAWGSGSPGQVWAKMTMKYPPLDTLLPGRLRSMYQSADEGMFIRSLHRYAIDGRVFGKKNRAPGGTILLDASGSMNWSVEQLYSVLERCPGAQIAFYSGDSHRGELVICAKGGRHCTDQYMLPAHGANGVDGLALEWLILQEAPRVWVSDGHVNGPGDANLQHAQRNMLVRLGHIGWIAPQNLSSVRELPPDGKALVYASGVGKGDTCIEAVIHYMKTNGARYNAI